VLRLAVDVVGAGARSSRPSYERRPSVAAAAVDGAAAALLLPETLRG
jgi:hypothetical protein